MDNYIVFVSVQHFFLSFLVCSILGLQTEKKIPRLSDITEKGIGTQHIFYDYF